MAAPNTTTWGVRGGRRDEGQPVGRALDVQGVGVDDEEEEEEEEEE